MFKILRREQLTENVVLMEVDAPIVAKKCMPGQFIILRVNELGERIPLTIAGYDREKGSVTIIFQSVGMTTRLLAEQTEGDFILDFVGPLGTPSELDGMKKVAIIGGGLGCAIAYPQAKALYEMGADVTMIAGFRNQENVILEKEMQAASNRFYLMSDDGSCGEKGLVTNKLQDLLRAGETFDAVIAIGPLVMMKYVCLTTKEYNIKTIVSMNPIMIDGTGMCGGCRVTVGGEMKFACVDGPDFDGHLVDFDEAIRRSRMYVERLDDIVGHACRMETMARKATRNINKQMTKTPMPEQLPHVRNQNFSEVALGYTEEMAINEARRCIGCKNRPCVAGCPVNVQIPEFLALVADGNFKEAYLKIIETNSLPAVCGRVCPQETQCEEKCVRGIKGEPVAIGRLERFCADWYMQHVDEPVQPVAKNNHRVAVIGAGPSGLTCASDLAKLGYDVTIFEAFHKAGGVLVYGIPEFRLPKAIVQKEVDKLVEAGVHLQCDVVVGKSFTIDELTEQGYEAIFIGSGAGLPSFMGIDGEHLNGVFSANEYLTRNNLMKAFKPEYDTPVIGFQDVVVVGGGNVAMDAARTAKRLGANVTIVYRRSEAELPARAEEIHHAIEEGIQFRLLSNPVRILGTKSGWVTGVECIQMELGEPDDSGRCRPIAVEGSEFVLDADAVIMSIGTSPNPILKNTTEGLKTNRHGCIVADEETGQTSKAHVYAGGDAVTGAATVILAMGAGKKAAAAIDREIMGK